MSSAFKAGLIQTNVSNEMAENVAFVREQARLARDAGADFIMTPENTGLIGANRAETLAKAQTEESHAMLAACARQRARDRRVVPAGLDPCPRAGRGADPQPLLPDRCGGRHRRELRQDPHVRRPAGRRRELSRDRRPSSRARRSVLAETPWGVAGHDDLLRPALSLSLSRPGACRRHDAVDPLVVHGADRTGALAHADARAGDRDRLLRVRAGPGRHAQGRPTARPTAIRSPSPRGARCWPMPAVGRRASSSPRSMPPRSPRRARWCRR